MPYVSRDESGKINGVYANLQPDYAEEFLPDDDPEVVAFIASTAIPATPSAPPETTVLYDHENRLRVIEGAPPLTLAEFITKAKL